LLHIKKTTSQYFRTETSRKKQLSSAYLEEVV